MNNTPQSFPASVPRASATLMLVAAVLLALLTLYAVAISWFPGPFRDMWIALELIRAGDEGAASWQDYFALHGGAHRLVVPRLLYWIDYHVFAGSNVFLVSVAVLVQVSIVILAARLAARDAAFSRLDRLLLLAMTVLLMFNATQLENFLYTFDVQWFITAAAAAWALAFYNQVFAARARGERVSIIGWLAVGVAAALSIFSSFSGLCLLLLLPVLAMMHRASSRIVIAMAVVMAIGLLAYLSGPFASSSDWAAPGVVTTAQYVHFLLSVAAVWLQWSGLYFGSPLSRALPIAGFVFAYGSLFYLVWQAWRVLRDSASSITAFRMTMLSIAWWAAIVGIATGLGRMYFVHTAPEDRYQSIVLIYWLGVFSAAFAHARARVSAERVVLAIILFWTLVVLPLASWAVLRFQVNFFDRVKDANVAIATGQWDFDDVKDTLILGDKWKKISRPQMYGEFLRAQRWGVFADPAAQQLGQTLNAAQIDLAACDGEIYNARWTAAPYHGLRLQGRGLNRELKPFEQLVIVDESNRQIGLARLQRPKDFLWPITWQDAQASHWLGYTLGLSEDVKNARVLGAYRANGFVRYCPVANQPLPLASPGESAK